MRVTLVHNPTAGDHPSSAEDLVRALTAAGHEVAYQSTADPMGIDQALADPGDLVVVAGGDGTVQRIASRLAGRRAPMAILPSGAGNNVAKAFGAIGLTRELIEGWRGGARRPVDLGLVRAPWGEERFIESVGGGIFAQLFARASRRAQADRGTLTGNRIDRELQMMKDVIEAQRPCRWQLRLDGRDLTGELLAFEAMNIRFLGANVPLAPGADPSDGCLDVVTVDEAQRETLLDYVQLRLAGQPASLALTVHRGRALQVSPGERPLHVDGNLRLQGEEERWTAPLEVELEQGAVELVGPQAPGQAPQTPPRHGA